MLYLEKVAKNLTNKVLEIRIFNTKTGSRAEMVIWDAFFQVLKW